MAVLQELSRKMESISLKMAQQPLTAKVTSKGINIALMVDIGSMEE